MGKRNRAELVMWAMIVVILPLVSISDLFTKPGLYAYSDQYFPLSTSLPPFYIISTSPANSLQFDRLIITWPYYLISLFTESMRMREFGFIYYTFILFSFLCLIFSYQMVKYFSERIHPLPPLTRNAGMLVIYFLAYANLSALNLNSDGGTWADSIVLILISISIVLMLNDMRSFRKYLIIGAFMALTPLLDPDYLPMFLLTVITISVVGTLVYKDIRVIMNGAISSLISLISIAYLYAQATLISPLGNNAGFNNIGYRSYTPGDLSWLSQNIGPFNVFLLIGHFWSTIVYAPPSILLYRNVYDLPSILYPAQVIIPTGLVFYVWIISLASIPVVSFSSLIFRSTRRKALPVFIVFILTYIIVEEWNFRFTYYFLRHLTYIPIFGNAIGTSLSLPGHFINLMAYLYLVLFSLAFLNMLYFAGRVHIQIDDLEPSQENYSKHGSMKEIKKIRHSKIRPRLYVLNKAPQGRIKLTMIDFRKKERRRALRTFIVFIIIFSLVILGNWQGLTYYPMRSYPGSYNIGNGVEAKGVFSPTVVNNSVIVAYDLVTSDYNQGYNTVWIGGPEVNDFTWARPPMSVSLSNISYIFENNLTNCLIPYLRAHSIKYVVVSNQDIAQSSPNPFIYFGFDSYKQGVDFLKLSHLKEIFSQNNVSVFQTPSVLGPIYKSQMMINPMGFGASSSVLYGLFSSIGINVSESQSGIPVGLNNSSASIDILTPVNDIPFGEAISVQNVSLKKPANFSSEYVLFYNRTGNTGPSYIRLEQSENYAFSGNLVSTILFRNNTSSYLGKYIIVNEPLNNLNIVYANGTIIKKYVTGNDNSYIFATSNENGTYISENGSLLLGMYLFYILIVTTIALLFFIGIRQNG